MNRNIAEMAETRAGLLRREIADTILGEFPELAVRVEGEAIAIEGRALLDRWLRDADLRDLPRLAVRRER